MIPLEGPMREFIFFYLFLIVLGSYWPAYAKEIKVCDHIWVMDGKLPLNENERILVCGTDKGAEAWRTIPIPQAILHLKTILQNQGYLNPRFERNGDELRVWRGDLTRIQNLRVEGADGILHTEKKRKIVGAALEPKKLNEVEAWANGEIRHQGFACAQISVEAHEWNAEILAKASLGTRKKIGELTTDGLDGLDPVFLNRYRPFEQGDVYDGRKALLMTSRLMADGLFQSAHFRTTCHDDTVDLKLETSVGKPKIFRFGAGASTEEFPFLDASFKNARLDNEASSFTTTLHLSPRKLSFSVGSELYWIPGSTRSFFGPRFDLARRIESSYETNTAAIGADIGRNWDMSNVRLIGRWGATMNYSKTIRGAGPGDIYYPTIDASLSLKDHDYEYSIGDQYEGWNAQFIYRGQSKGLGSSADVNRYRVDLKSLWNIGAFSPPLFVFGTRIEAVAVDADEIDGDRNRNLVPVEDRIYLGGDQNLRGFTRQSINNGDLGFLTSLYLGFELRLIEELPFHLQPFLLFDAARVGNRRYTLDAPVFISEGAGLRWASPFGTLRGSAARGHVENGDATTAGFKDQWVYFLSFGQEF